MMMYSVNRSTCPTAGSLAIFADSLHDACCVAAYYHGGEYWEYVACVISIASLLLEEGES